MSLEFKKTTPDEVEIHKEIYNYYVEHTTYTFQIELADTKCMESILFYDDPRYQAFTIRDDGEIVGYCIIEKYHNRKAYDITSEVAIYLKHDVARKGIGTHAMQFLEKEAKKREFVSLISIISAENEPSIALFKKLKYKKIAHYEKVGKKFNRLIDVVVYQKLL